MYVFDHVSYRRAFIEYIRHGTPIERLSTKAEAADSYVWHTVQDDKVRLSHRVNDGRIFRWNDPPTTGHPGDGFNCRCTAVQFTPGETEFAFHQIEGLGTTAPYRWGDTDFVAHYYYGGGQTVTLAEIGHLPEIVEQYSYLDAGIGALRRLSNQIANEARSVIDGPFDLPFGNAYEFGDVEFSHGGGTVSGFFDGHTSLHGRILRLVGRSQFHFTDRFEDPVGLGIELGGTPYAIEGRWAATFQAEVFLDPSQSAYK